MGGYGAAAVNAGIQAGGAAMVLGTGYVAATKRLFWKEKEEGKGKEKGKEKDDKTGKQP